MHGCSRDCIYNHSLDCRDLAATTVRAHLIINIKYLIGENDCLNTTEKLLLQLNERNSLTWVLNNKIDRDSSLGEKGGPVWNMQAKDLGDQSQ